jgi:hypothetical protein
MCLHAAHIGRYFAIFVLLVAMAVGWRMVTG